jgi:murein L,D-transpeptidase YcbB/YkuD
MNEIYFSTIDGILPATIRVGSQGDAVVAWQKIIGVEPDGMFGPQTAAATKVWQKQHGLEPDGVVGPLTWGKAERSVGSALGSLSTTTMLLGAAAIASVGWWLWGR